MRTAARTGAKRSQATPRANGSPSPGKSPGRPSKLETRAWEWFSAHAMAATPDGGLRQLFEHSVRIASEFDRMWKERSE